LTHRERGSPVPSLLWREDAGARAHPINCYSIGDRTPGLKNGADGSLTIHIQRESPGKARESNWLPAPDGPFYVILRTYGPKPELLDGSYKIPPVQMAK
jgi:hypothetical protein